MSQASMLFNNIKKQANELQANPDILSEMSKQVIGLALQDSTIIFSLLEDGFQPRYLVGDLVNVFIVMNEMVDQKIDIDPISVAMKYEEKFKENILPKLTNLVSEVMLSASNVRLCGTKLREAFQISQSTRLVAEYADLIKENGVVEIENLMQQLTEVTSINRMYDHSMVEACDGFTTHLEKLQDLKPGELIGVDSGVDSINESEGGYYYGDLIIVGARPGMGKTAFALNSIMRASQRGIPCGIFSTEMRKEQLAARMICSSGRLPYTKTRTGFLDDTEWGLVSQGMSNVYDLPIRIADKPTLYIDEIKAISRYWVAHYGIKAIFVDYLQNLAQRNQTKARSELVGSDAKALKALALELGIPVIVLAQLNRDSVEKPRVNDLKESGDIEQAADVIYLLYRDEVTNPNTQMKGVMEIITGKARFGPLCSHYVRFNGKYQSFSSLTDEDMLKLEFA